MRSRMGVRRLEEGSERRRRRRAPKCRRACEVPVSGPVRVPSRRAAGGCPTASDGSQAPPLRRAPHQLSAPRAPQPRRAKPSTSTMLCCTSQHAAASTAGSSRPAEVPERSAQKQHRSMRDDAPSSPSTPPLVARESLRMRRAGAPHLALLKTLRWIARQNRNQTLAAEARGRHSHMLTAAPLRATRARRAHAFPPAPPLPRARHWTECD